MQPSTVVLTSELTLFEYDTCVDQAQANELFERRQCLQPYLARGWLARSSDGDAIQATHFVGLLPFADAGRPHLLLVAPKGSQQNMRLGLLRFLELLALSEGQSPPEDMPGLEGMFGQHRFLLFLAHHYAHLLQELCRRDFRSYYRAEEGDLRSRIRGHLHLASYAALRFVESNIYYHAVGTSLPSITGITASLGLRYVA